MSFFFYYGGGNTKEKNDVMECEFGNFFPCNIGQAIASTHLVKYSVTVIMNL
jgi:hypothetical protein